MERMKIALLLALSLCAGALAPAANASVLYKSVAPNGVVTFSDTPPDNSDRVERIPMTFSAQQPSGGYTASGSSDGMPIYGSNPQQVAVANFEDLKSFDVAVAEANERVDRAERALAEARSATISRFEGLRLAGARPGPDDVARIEASKRDVLLARQSLLETLRAKNRSTR